MTESFEAMRSARAHQHAQKMLCASCSEETSSDPCAACNKPALLDGRFRLEEVIGRGAMGTTYRATRLEDGADVAVKEVAFRHAKDLKDWELGRREADVLKQLDHPRIPKYYDHFLFGQGKNTALFIVQQLIRGRSLAKEMEHKRYTEDQVLAILEELLPTLGHLHELTPSIIHRDLKPSNVMRRDHDGALMLIDFGTVRDAMKDPKLGGSTIVGTYGYMAPEQYEGRATPATDLYGLGALALALLSREDPSTMMRHGVQLDWRSHVSVSPPFAELLEALLAPDVDARPQSTHQVLERVRRIRSGEIVRPLPRPLPNLDREARLEADAKQKRLARGMIVGGIAAVLMLAGMISAVPGKTSTSAQQPQARPYWSYIDQGYPEEIEAWCTKRNLPRACFRWGQLQMERGRTDDALATYQKACDRLNGAACNTLGDLYAKGHHVPASAEKAAAYFKAACAGGHEGACTRGP